MQRSLLMGRHSTRILVCWRCLARIQSRSIRLDARSRGPWEVDNSIALRGEVLQRRKRRDFSVISVVRRNVWSMHDEETNAAVSETHLSRHPRPKLPLMTLSCSKILRACQSRVFENDCGYGRSRMRRISLFRPPMSMRLARGKSAIV